MNAEVKQLIRRAQDAYERRDFVAALADFREVAAENPEFADVQQMMGLCYSFLGQPEAALEQYDRALEANDCYIEALLHRAITLNELGRFDEAEQSYARAGECERRLGGRFSTSVSAKLANAHASLGELYMAASAPQEAAAEFRRALDLRSGFHDIRNRLAEALMQAGDLEGAQAELERATEGNERFLRALLNLGLVHFRQGETANAREVWERAAAVDPESPQVRAYLRLVSAGS